MSADCLPQRITELRKGWMRNGFVSNGGDDPEDDQAAPSDPPRNRFFRPV